MIRDATDVLDEFIAEYAPKETGGTVYDHNANYDSPNAVIERAIKYLAKMPIAVDGSNGSKDCYKAACVCRKGFMLSVDESLQALHEWNLSCQPPWSERELRHKLDDAGKASGPSGYLRKTQESNWQSVTVPEYVEPVQKQKRRAEPTQERTTLHEAAIKSLANLQDGKQGLMQLGLPGVDSAIGGGAAPGEIVLMAARPSHGKSAMALQIVDFVTGNGIPCVFMSEEMSSISLGKRITQSVTSVPQEHWLSRNEIVRSHINNHFVQRADCHIIEHSRTAERVADEICKLAKNEGVQLAVVDYVQLLTNAKKSRYETVTESSVILKQAASESGVVLVSLAQVSRAFEHRDTLTPKVSDLKESGQLEQDADVILFLVWPSRLDTTKPPYEYQIYIAKNRNREIVSHNVELIFQPSRQRVVLPDQDWSPNL